MSAKNKKRLIWQIPFLVVLIIGTVLIIRQQQNMPYLTNKGFIFGTTYSITYQSDQDYEKEILAELNKVDAALSMFNKSSIISNVNNNKDMKVNNMFLEVFNLAQTISGNTEGAFDITVAPLVNAWGFGFKSGNMPTRQQVDSIQQFIGYRKVSIDHMKVKKADPRLMLDCSAIAKGYGVDAVARLLKKKGVNNFTVEIGGEIATRGVSARRAPWRIGVVKPTEDSLLYNNEYQTILNLSDIAMATSGNYRNFYYKGCRKYAHTIDPKTGYPVQHSLLSATVLANTCAEADAYATAFMVMGMEGAKQILEKEKQLMAYFIYTDEKGKIAVWYSPEMKNKIEQLP